jgi:small basic protein (TIGR04137 family)
MSRHSSLRRTTSKKQKRSVLTRAERVEILKKRNLWSENSKAFGLAKTLA